MDLSRWTRLWQRLGAGGDGRAVFVGLAAAYAEPTRAYHTAQHIEDCLALLDDSRALAERPDEIEAAIWFHDAVYVPLRSDNEERSAELARTSLLRAEVDADVANRIRTLILETRHETSPGEPDAALLCDIDLSILGRPPDRFDRFEHQIRREYALVPESMYRRRRSEILQAFLDRPSIFQTVWYRERFEKPARANLARVLATLAG